MGRGGIRPHGPFSTRRRTLVAINFRLRTRALPRRRKVDQPLSISTRDRERSASSQSVIE